MSYVRYEDCEVASLLSIYHNASEGFKPSNVEVFNFLACNSRARDILDNLKLYPLVRTEPQVVLTHLSQVLNQSLSVATLTEPDLKKAVEQKVKLEVDYYRFLKG